MVSNALLDRASRRGPSRGRERFRFSDHGTLAGILATVVAALTAVVTFLNPQERANGHHVAGVKFNAVRNQARLFREVDLEEKVVPPDVSDRLRKLAESRDQLNLSSPQIPRAFEKARRGIEAGEASYAVDSAK